MMFAEILPHGGNRPHHLGNRLNLRGAAAMAVTYCKFWKISDYLGGFMTNFNLFKSFYAAFVKDFLRFYRLVPGALRRRLWLVFVLQVVSALTETLTVFVLAFFGLSLGASEAARNQALVRAFFDYSPFLAELAQDQRILVAFCAALVLAFILMKNTVAACSLNLNCDYAERVSAYIGRQAISCFLHQSYYWHLSSASRDFITKMLLRGALSGFLISILTFYSNLICCLVVFVALLAAEPRLTALVMVIFSLVSLSAYYSFRRRMDKAGQNAARLAVAENAALMTAQKAVREIISFQNQEAFIKAIDRDVQERIHHQRFLSLAPMIPSWLLEVTGFGIILAAILYLIKSGAAMPQIVGSISLLLLTAWRVLPAVSRAMGTTVGIRGQRPQALLCLELLEELKHSERTTIPAPDPDFRFTDRLILEEVSFSYPAGQGDALADISLTIKKGESIGLIGASGAGKSTLALVLSGLVPLKSGRMLVDDLILTPERQAALVRKTGFVPQVPFLLGGTVADNVAFSRWSQDYDTAEVEEVCRKAAMDFIFKTPEGIRTPIDPEGGGLSGGQTQRLAIARALFTKPEVLIMDEATSALDQANENIVKQTLRSLDKSITVIIIAHRLSTVENCDRVFWIDDGRLRATGPPAEILPRYKAQVAFNPD